MEPGDLSSTTPGDARESAARTAAFERDRRLLHRWRDGEGEAGVELLGHYEPLFLRIARNGGLRRKEDLVDLWQEVVLAALVRLPELPERIERSFAGWFAFLVRGVLRTNARRRQTLETLPADLPGPGSDPGRQLATWESIERCAEALPPRESAVFALRYVEGLSMKEIAARLASNVNAVCQAVLRLTRKMRACLEEHDPQDGTSRPGP